MTTTTETLVAAVVGVLTTKTNGAYPTQAGARVYEPRDWPTWDNQYPVLLISAPRERKESLGRNAPKFTVVTTVRVSARASSAASADDGNAGVVQATLWAMQRQIEVAIINAYTVQLPIQQILSVESQLTFDSSGEKHLGELLIDLDLEFYQGTNDFAPIPSAPLELVGVTFTDFPPTGATIPLPQS
jgi:hypothetical protein